MAKTVVTTRVFKGSGYIFVRKHSDKKTYPPVADMDNMTKEEAEAIDAFIRELAVAENELGLLKNGINFVEEITALEDQDDMGRQKISDIQSEKANSSFALFGANVKTIEKMHPLAKAAVNEETGMRLLNLGGIPNKDDSSYDILFVHPDTDEGDISFYQVGKNITGLNINVLPSQVSPLNCNYAAEPIDDTGVLYKIFEHMKGKPVYEPGKGTQSQTQAAAQAASAGTESAGT